MSLRDLGAFSLADRTIVRLLDVRARSEGGKRFLSMGDRSWTYAEMAELGRRMGGVLAAHGVGRGDHVALICTNRVELVELCLGCAWLGAVLVPINVAVRGPQLQHILVNSRASLLVLEEGLLPGLDRVDLAATDVRSIAVIGEGAAGAVQGLAPAPLRRDPVAHEPTPAEPADTAYIIYTSGTTGPSKGVCCPHAQFYWWGVHTADLLELGQDDVLCTTLPMFHVNALNTLYQAILVGGEVAVEERFSVSRFWRTLIDRRATATFVLGAMIPMLLSAPPSPLERAHRTRVALAPGVPRQHQEAFTARTGIALIDGYGSTETNFVIGTVAGETLPGYMGKLRPGFEARVADHEDREVPDGTPGELLVRASEPYSMADGYYGMPERTVESWRNLWFHSGDRVVRDANGYYRFVDRLKDSIRRRGENISSYEIEQVLAGHPDVTAAIAYAAKSELAEDEVMVVIVPRADARIDPLELVKFCEGRLAYFAIPRFIRFLADVPVTENGKVQKYKLIEQGVTDDTWDLQRSGYKVSRA